MNLFDSIVIGFVLFAFVWGLSSGLIRLAAGTGGFMAGMFIASRYNEYVASALAPYVPMEFLQRAIAYVFLLMAVAIVIKLIAGMISSRISGSILGKFDRTAGAVVIASIAVMTVGTVVHLLGALPLGGATKALDESLIAPRIANASVFAASKPWCASLPEDHSGEECSTLTSVAGDLSGVDVGGKIDEVTDGQGVGGVVQRYVPFADMLFD